MNKPVGVPSGWEEIAAYYAVFGVSNRYRNIDMRETSATWYVDSDHDWRVLE